MDPNLNQPSQAQQQSPPPTLAQPQPQLDASPRPKGLAVTALVLSILGLLTSFIGIGILLALVALILGIVSLSKRLGGKGLSIAAIAVSGATMLFGGILLAITIVAYNGIQERASTSANQSMAASITKKAEAYSVIEGTVDKSHYPTYRELIANDIPEASLDSDTASLLHEGGASSVSKEAPIAYRGCSYGAVIHYYSSLEATPGRYIVGDFSRC